LKARWPSSAAVLALAERGAKVVVADVDRRCDVTKTEDLGSAFDWAVEHFGQFDIAFKEESLEELRTAGGILRPEDIAVAWWS
jgi:NAD(P)-dependent dehydrogenase (short-subunit alcohol dehydrogenase family)